MTRDASARRIQRWLRGQRFRRAVAARVHATQQQWQRTYSLARLERCTKPSAASASTVVVDPAQRTWHHCATTLQRHTRGFLTRQALRQWRRMNSAVRQIQRLWRQVIERRREVLGVAWTLRRCSRPLCSCSSARVIDAVARFGADVRQLQRVCVVQDLALTELWDNTTRLRRYLDARITKAVVRFQVR